MSMTTIGSIGAEVVIAGLAQQYCLECKCDYNVVGVEAVKVIGIGK